MSNDIYTILDNCLTMMEQGSDLESCLARYPEAAAELRPLLLAAMDAASISKIDVPADVMRRNKAKILNTAAEMREQRASRKVLVFPPFKRILKLSLAALAVIVFMAGMGGTGLVSASNGALPGDQLYPVKLTWESIRLKMALAQAEREALEDRFKQERVEEINDLFEKNRFEEVEFHGQVEGIFPGQLIVSGILVTITPNTQIIGDIKMNALVEVEGRTDESGSVLADKVKVDSSGSDDAFSESSKESEDEKGGKNLEDDNKSGGKESDRGDDKETKTPEDSATEEPEKSESEEEQHSDEAQSFEIEGIVSQYNGSTITVINKRIFITPATEIQGNLVDGSRVSIRGYVNGAGEYVAKKIQVESTSDSGGEGGDGGDSGSSSGGGGGGSGGGGDDDDDDPTKTPEPEEPDD